MQDKNVQKVLLENVMNTVVDGIITINEKGVIETVNPAVEKLFGYPEIELIGQNVKILMPDDYASKHDEYLQKYKQTKQKSIIGTGRQVVGQRKDSSTFPMHLSVGEMKLDGKVHYTGVIRDMSDLIDSYSEAVQFKEALDNTLDMIFMFRPSDYQFIYANKGAVRSMEYDFDELMTLRAFDIKPDVSESEFKEMVQPLINSEVNSLQFETIHRTKSGKDFPVAISLQLIQTNNSERRFVAIVHDITERRKVENMKKEFVSTVSHELRTPLTSIRGSLALVLSKIKAKNLLPPKLENMLELAERNSERLTLLINDILDLEKIESGILSLDFKHENIFQVAKKAYEDNKGYAQKHNVSIEFDPLKEPLYVNIDEHRILQVFSNLLSNAIKFSPEKGTVTIEVKPYKDSVKVSVKDNGRGIPEKFKSSIFGKFLQADSSDSREKGGTGLGLSISQAIINQHNGKIGFESTEGVGTEFYFILKTINVVEETFISKKNTYGTVLICEDDHDLATVYQSFLLEHNYSSIVVDSVSDAREKLLSNSFKLIILDLQLKNSYGLDLYKDKNLQPILNSTPVVIISGHIPNEIISDKNLGLKIMDWSEKPLNMDRLAQNLKKIEGNFNKPSILHIEDDPDLLQLTSMLVDSWTDYSYVKTVAGAKSQLNTNKPNLVLLDLELQDGSGIELIPIIKKLKVPIIVFTGQAPDNRELLKDVDAVLIKSVSENNDLIDKIKAHLPYV